MPSYKLIYLNAMGRAEILRWLLAYGNVPFTDERIEEADYEEKRKTIPFKKVPILMVDEVPVPNCMAIARYLAKEVGLIPQDGVQAAYADALSEAIAGVMDRFFTLMLKKSDDEEKRKEFMEEFYPSGLELMLTKLNKKLEGKEWFGGDQIAWCDLMIGVSFGILKKHQPDVIAKFPNIDAHITKVEELPQIKAWIAKRPQTQL